MWFFMLSLLIGSPKTCMSTEFGYHNDHLSGSVARYLKRPIDPQADIGIAHRYLPLGSLVVLHAPKRGTFVLAVVIDRGPYGRIRPKGSECPSHGKLRPDGTCWVNGAYEYREGNKKYRECRQRGGKNCISPLNKSCYYKGSRWNGGSDLAPKTVRLLRGPNDIQPPGRWRERIVVYPIRNIRIPRSYLLQIWGGNV